MGGEESGRKFDAGKPRFDLIPVRPLLDLATLYGMGAEKYGDRNWESGLGFGRVYGALQRHAWAWWDGERDDPEDGQPHLIAVAWNALALHEYERTHPEFDNRPVMPNPLLGRAGHRVFRDVGNER